MFNPSNFCHIASNARNRQKAAVFLYRNDGHDTPTHLGFFDSKATELNKGDLIIVVPPLDGPLLSIEYNLYQVVAKTTDTVEVRQINSTPENAIIRDKTDRNLDFMTPVTSTNKGATATQINELIEQIAGLKIDLEQEIQDAIQELNNTLATKATKATDFVTPLTDSNKGITQTDQDALEAELKDDINRAATSGTLVKSYWFGKTNADTEVPAPTLPGQNYYNFVTGQAYKTNELGTQWVEDSTYTPPTDVDVQIGITSKFWDIPEQTNQHGGVAKWSHTESDWAYYPNVYEDPVGGASLPLLARLISDHKFNDVSYLNANTFSWQSGAVYEAVYQHLVDDLATAGPVKTLNFIGGTLTYEEAADGHRICLANQEGALDDLYLQTGAANFYLLDTENARFKLPRTTKRTLIRTKRWPDGRMWYNLYSDGWIEQGGTIDEAVANTQYSVVFPISMADDKYTATTSGAYGDITPNDTSTATRRIAGVLGGTPADKTYLGMKVTVPAVGTATNYTACWRVEGYALASEIADEPVQYEYYYVGNFTQTAVENTAGITAETLNQKADLDLANVLANIDFVVESQLPTAENSYTWYRKYKSGWVEQGGYEVTIPGTSDGIAITYPVPLQFAVAPSVWASYFNNSPTNAKVPRAKSITTTGAVLVSTGLNNNYCNYENTTHVGWMVVGYAA